jgi:hypothetical protein
VTYFVRFLKAIPSRIGVVGGLKSNGLFCDLRRTGIPFVVFVVKSVTLAFEGLGTKGAKMDLVISVLCGGFGGIWAETLRRPFGPFEVAHGTLLLLRLDLHGRFLPCL